MTTCNLLNHEQKKKKSDDKSRIRRDFTAIVHRIMGKKASLFSDGSPTTINNGIIHAEQLSKHENSNKLMSGNDDYALSDAAWIHSNISEILDVDYAMTNVSFDDQSSEEWELNIVASIYLSVFIIYIVPYLICIYVVVKAKDLINKPYYQILLHMALADVVQIFNSLFSCVFTLMRNEEPFWSNKLAGALTDGCWFLYCCLAHILALNRFVSMYFPLKVGEYFSARRTKIIIGVAWVYGTTWIGALTVPGYTFMFFIEFYTWDYAENYGSAVARRLNLTSDMFHLTVLVVWYTLIFIKLRQKYDVCLVLLNLFSTVVFIRK
uniref:G-protein coupled receptors family 1 profile domain-containing protein n=1 Tax=Romanomermis culicivorax TaxID=13658 RepID=A0A915JMI1_ROMCU